jgi:hypothetical protein
MLYHFNLTDGDRVICDNEGLHLPSVHAAVTSAIKAIAELRQEDPTDSSEWQDWTLEITDATGWVVRSISLEARAEVRLC